MTDEPPFGITAGFDDRAARVAVTGDLDIINVSLLAGVLTTVLDTRPSRLVVDLSGVEYLSCAAARAISEVAQALPGQKLVIWNPAPIVRRLLQLTGLATFIEVSDPIPGPQTRGQPALAAATPGAGRSPGRRARATVAANGAGRPAPAARPGSLAQRSAATDPQAVAVTAAVEGHICALTVTGELDLAAAGWFTAHAAQVMAALDSQPERLVLDLGGLAFLDCAGARALEQVTGTIPPGCPVIVRAVSPAAARLLKLAGLNLERPPAPDAVVPPHEQLAQRVQMTRARMAELAASIRETAVQLAGTGDRMAATFAKLAEQRPQDADRLSALSTAALEFAARSRRKAIAPL